MVWRPLYDLVAGASDVARPLRLAEVLDTSEWAATGPSFVQVRVAGDSRRAIYRDGPQPAVGSALQCVRMSADAAALYLCLPLPIGCAGDVYVSLRLVGGSGTTYIVARLDLAALTWTYLSDHPGSGSARRPLVAAGGVNLLTWADGGTLYRSADLGATWGATGVGGVRDVTQASNEGRVYAATDGGLYRSDDYGATWAALGVGAFLRVTQDMAGATGLGYEAVTLLATDGMYLLINEGPAVDGPFTPAPVSGAGGVERRGSESFYWPGAGDLYEISDGVAELHPGGMALTSSWAYHPDGVPAYETPYPAISYPGGGAGATRDWGGDLWVLGGEAWGDLSPLDAGGLQYDGTLAAVRDVAVVASNAAERQPIALFGPDHLCYLLALDVTDAATPALLLRDGTTAALTYAPVPTTIGSGQYAVSEKGLATLEVWRINES